MEQFDGLLLFFIGTSFILFVLLMLQVAKVKQITHVLENINNTNVEYKDLYHCMVFYAARLAQATLRLKDYDKGFKYLVSERKIKGEFFDEVTPTYDSLFNYLFTRGIFSKRWEAVEIKEIDTGAMLKDRALYKALGSDKTDKVTNADNVGNDICYKGVRYRPVQNENT